MCEAVEMSKCYWEVYVSLAVGDSAHSSGFSNSASLFPLFSTNSWIWGRECKNLSSTLPGDNHLNMLHITRSPYSVSYSSSSAQNYLWQCTWHNEIDHLDNQMHHTLNLRSRSFEVRVWFSNLEQIHFFHPLKQASFFSGIAAIRTLPHVLFFLVVNWATSIIVCILSVSHLLM